MDIKGQYQGGRAVLCGLKIDAGDIYLGLGKYLRDIHYQSQTVIAVYLYLSGVGLLYSLGLLPLGLYEAVSRLMLFFLDKPKTECFGYIRLETLVVVVDGCLASDDWFPFCRVGLFFSDKKVELINMLQGYIVKGLELAKAFKCLVCGQMPFPSAFTERTVADALPKPCHEVTTVAAVSTQVGLELGDGHIVLIHLHGDKDMLKLGYFLLDFLVDDNGTRMIHHQSILPLVNGDAMS